MLDALGIDAGFAERDDAHRAAVLLRLLSEKPPAAADLAVAAVTTEASAEAWRLFRLLARMRSLYRPESLGPFIISMTRGAADLLTVLLLGRWAGCAPAPPIKRSGTEMPAARQSFDKADLDMGPLLAVFGFPLEIREQIAFWPQTITFRRGADKSMTEAPG
jgi:hypothetical protein